jgi:hypothetical protein
MIITLSPPFCSGLGAEVACLFDRVPPAANRCGRLARSVMIEATGGERVKFGNLYFIYIRKGSITSLNNFISLSLGVSVVSTFSITSSKPVFSTTSSISTPG